MCGIVAFTGNKDAVPVLLGGLFRLEYRGYDSAGIALQNICAAPANTIPAGDLQAGRAQAAQTQPAHQPQPGGSQAVGHPPLHIIKRVGKVAELRKALEDAHLSGAFYTGIGHTRWATHGAPSEANAHPHCDCSQTIAVVHNGIIENYAQLRQELQGAGHRFVSQTDTEVVAHLIEQEYQVAPGKLMQAVRRTVARLSGSFALAICHSAHPGQLVVTRNDSPLALGTCPDGAIAASDTPALIEHTRQVYYLNDRDLAVLHQNGHIEFFDPAGTPSTPTAVTIEWDLEDAQRGGYADFMLKEISEQPRVIKDTLAGRLDASQGRLLFEELALSHQELAAADRVVIVACGTSYHAGLIGKDLIETWARLPVEVEVSSEFRYRNPLLTPQSLVIAISQSGETADTLEAVKLARRAGAHVIALTNVVGSRITMEANEVILIKAHLEIAVAATKSFLAQVALLTLLAMHLARQRGQACDKQVLDLYRHMQQLPIQISEILANTTSIERCAQECSHAQTALFIGRGVGATTCYEGALKLKEISYLHAEAFAAGEIKHGPIALINPDGLADPAAQTPVIAVACKSATYDKMLANIEEMLARGAKVIALATVGDARISELTPHVIFIPETPECLSPILASVPLQLFARFIAVARGANVDQPRNLAKSVTVE
ncbi:MAG: glutamine--fructose-6-phosphate transaminase (isomerizing) [Coriobacteriales bacterium]|jgi:glucosamine--fructose-6-phosphate aminotransferase (isomerizing)|nr:glutamine--fructose-6-phosphate transaminase (isomerizing) [Coriobacteriales bacterium]